MGEGWREKQNVGVLEIVQQRPLRKTYVIWVERERKLMALCPNWVREVVGREVYKKTKEQAKQKGQKTRERGAEQQQVPGCTVVSNVGEEG